MTPEPAYAEQNGLWQLVEREEYYPEVNSTLRAACSGDRLPIQLRARPYVLAVRRGASPLGKRRGSDHPLDQALMVNGCIIYAA